MCLGAYVVWRSVATIEGNSVVALWQIVPVRYIYAGLQGSYGPLLPQDLSLKGKLA
jgi:hypothetical protein